jgi:hypothetical protein
MTIIDSWHTSYNITRQAVSWKKIKFYHVERLTFNTHTDTLENLEDILSEMLHAL